MPASVRDDAPTATDATSPHYTDSNKRRLHSSVAPHVKEPFAPLVELATRALRRYGEFNPGTVAGEAMQLFLDFSNDIIEDLRQHPYWVSTDIDYYEQMDETREIPDKIVVAGLLYYYAYQQASKKAEGLGHDYFRVMNGILFDRLYGNKKIEMQPPDKMDFTRIGNSDKIDPSQQWE